MPQAGMGAGHRASWASVPDTGPPGQPVVPDTGPPGQRSGAGHRARTARYRARVRPRPGASVPGIGAGHRRQNDRARQWCRTPGHARTAGQWCRTPRWCRTPGHRVTALVPDTGTGHRTHLASGAGHRVRTPGRAGHRARSGPWRRTPGHTWPVVPDTGSPARAPRCRTPGQVRASGAGHRARRRTPGHGAGHRAGSGPVPDTGPRVPDTGPDTGPWCRTPGRVPDTGPPDTGTPGHGPRPGTPATGRVNDARGTGCRPGTRPHLSSWTPIGRIASPP